MTDNKLIEVAFVLDRSGSMAGKEEDIIGGFNSMIEKYRNEDTEALVTTILFDDRITTLHDRIPMSEVKKMTDEEYYVGGCTALLDAVGYTVEHISEIHKYIERMPVKTFVVVMTDGYENASKKFTKEKLSRLVKLKEENDRWEFVFVGADIDAFAESHNVGISDRRAVRFSKTDDNLGDVFEATGEMMFKIAPQFYDLRVSDEAVEEVYRKVRDARKKNN